MRTSPKKPIHERFRKRTSWRDAVAGSILLGAASGLRSQIGVAVLAVRSDSSLPPILRQPWTRRVLVAGAVGELIADKLPNTPSRLEPPGIAGRLVLGALAAGLFARTRQALQAGVGPDRLQLSGGLSLDRETSRRTSR